MLIISIAVTVLVAAMGNIFIASANNRGYSRLETNMRAFAEAMQQKASFKTSISSNIDESTTSVPISGSVTSFGDTAKTGSYPGCTDVESCTNFPFFIVVDAETMQVTGLVNHDPSQLQVVRPQIVNGESDNGSDPVKHKAGAPVTQLFGCPIAGNDDSSSTSNGDYDSQYVGYLYPSGFASTDSKITVSIVSSAALPLSPAYWDPLNTTGGLNGHFDWTQASCWAPTITPPAQPKSVGFSNLCPSTGAHTGYLLPQCDTGLELVTLSGTDSSNGLSSDSTATMQVLVRRGSQ